MKAVINTCFGGFSINYEIAKQYFGGNFYKIERTNTTLIDLMESGTNCNAAHSNLKVVNIPDDATDWRIIKYDEGAEYVIYVVDGKLHSIY